jgi:hypothetical protein
MLGVCFGRSKAKPIANKHKTTADEPEKQADANRG